MGDYASVHPDQPTPPGYVVVETVNNRHKIEVPEGEARGRQFRCYDGSNGCIHLSEPAE